MWGLTRLWRNPHAGRPLWGAVLLKLLCPPLLAVAVTAPAIETNRDRQGAAPSTPGLIADDRRRPGDATGAATVREHPCRRPNLWKRRPRSSCPRPRPPPRRFLPPARSRSLTVAAPSTPPPPCSRSGSPARSSSGPSPRCGRGGSAVGCGGCRTRGTTLAARLAAAAASMNVPPPRLKVSESVGPLAWAGPVRFGRFNTARSSSCRRIVERPCRRTPPRRYWPTSARTWPGGTSCGGARNWPRAGCGGGCRRRGWRRRRAGGGRSCAATPPCCAPAATPPTPPAPSPPRCWPPRSFCMPEKSHPSPPPPAAPAARGSSRSVSRWSAKIKFPPVPAGGCAGPSPPPRSASPPSASRRGRRRWPAEKPIAEPASDAPGEKADLPKTMELSANSWDRPLFPGRGDVHGVRRGGRSRLSGASRRAARGPLEGRRGGRDDGDLSRLRKPAPARSPFAWRSGTAHPRRPDARRRRRGGRGDA